MTTAPGVLSAISGGVLRPWQYASSVVERQELVDRLLDGSGGHILFYLWDHPMGKDEDSHPGQQLKVVYRDGYGVAHFINMDAARGPVGAWLARTDTPTEDAPRPIFDPWDPGRVSVPVDAVLTIDRIRKITIEYALTGDRPRAADWISVDFA